METGVLVPDRHLVEPKFARAQLPEVFSGFRSHMFIHFDFDATDIVPSHLNIHENHGVSGVYYRTVFLPGGHLELSKIIIFFRSVKQTSLQIGGGVVSKLSWYNHVYWFDSLIII